MDRPEDSGGVKGERGEPRKEGTVSKGQNTGRREDIKIYPRHTPERQYFIFL